ncbi:type II secretion system F family protein [Helicobacter sp. T3_23-1056]
MRFVVKGTKGSQKVKIFVRADSKQGATQKAINKGIYPLEINQLSNGEGQSIWHKIFGEILGDFVANLFGNYAQNFQSIFTKKDFANKLHLKSLFSPPLNPLTISQDLALLSIMLESALPIKDAFISLERSTPSPILASAYRKILATIHNGESLEKAITPFKNIYTPMGIALIKAGIKGGKLAFICKILSEYFHHISTTKSNISKALFYPAFVCISAIFAFVFIAYFVIPQFSELFLSFGIDLPFSSKSLIFVSEILQDFGLYMLLFLCVVLGFVARGLRVKNRVYFYIYRVLLDMPFFGKIMLYRDLWVYFLSFLHLYEAGVDFDTTLKVSLQTIQNPHLKNELSHTIFAIKNGKNLYEAFVPCPHIEANVKHFLAIAQQSGELAKMLKLCVQYYKSKYEHLSAKILTYIEPFSTILIALLVAWLAFGIFLPIWELGSIGF